MYISAYDLPLPPLLVDPCFIKFFLIFNLSLDLVQLFDCHLAVNLLLVMDRFIPNRSAMDMDYALSIMSHRPS